MTEQVYPVFQHFGAHWTLEHFGRGMHGAVVPVGSADVEETFATSEALALASRQLDDSLKLISTETRFFLFKWLFFSSKKLLVVILSIV